MNALFSSVKTTVTRGPECGVIVPVGGNGWCCQGSAVITNKGVERWLSTNDVCIVYAFIKVPGSLKLSLCLNPKGHSVLQITVLGETKILDVTSESEKEFFVGKWNDVPKGYLKIRIQGVEKTGPEFGTISRLIMRGSCSATKKSVCVSDDSENFFYWGRRGPSVHLRFITFVKEIEWFYSEITVPAGNDVIGSFFMANGFSQGYFGMQVNSSTERRILFSVWSPCQTDDPSKIPPEDKIQLIRKGQQVKTGVFGNEGSGGQSYLVYPWECEKTYRFLLRAKPKSASQSTIFTAFFAYGDDWQLLASFERPKLATSIEGLHSFLENFNPEFGYKERLAFFHNQWVVNSKGTWTEITEAVFTADKTARKRYRRDFGAGTVDTKFYLKNCGFFWPKTKLDTTIHRQPSGNKPQIDLRSFLVN